MANKSTDMTCKYQPPAFTTLNEEQWLGVGSNVESPMKNIPAHHNSPRTFKYRK